MALFFPWGRVRLHMAMSVRVLCMLGCFVSALSSMVIADDTLRLGVIAPPPHKWTKAAVAVKEEIAQFDKPLNLGIFPSGQLGNEAQMLQLLQTGAMDFAFLTSSELANRLPEFAAFYIPYLADDAAHAARILEGEVADEILAETKKLGLVGLGFGMAGMRQIVSREPITAAKGLRGMKVRVMPDLPLTDFWRLAGSAPTPIPLSALYDAFANGQIDAMHIDFENTLRLKFYQHSSSVVHSDHMMFPLVALASARSWARFSELEREVLMQTFKKHLKRLRSEYVEADETFKAALEADGVVVHKMGAEIFGDASEEWYKRWSSRTKYVALMKEEAARVR